MGEVVSLLRPGFNGSIRVEARPERLGAETGALVLREVDAKLGVTARLAAQLSDPRDPDQITHPLVELLRTSLQLLALGWRDADDADALRDDAVLRMAVSERRGVGPLETRPPEERERNHNPAVPDGLASQPTLSRMTSMWTGISDRTVLRETLCWTAGQRLRATNGGRKLAHMTIDVDALPIEVHGQQMGADYNGYMGCNMFHPLVASSAETGDLLDVQLRHGSSHSAEGALWFISDVVTRAEEELCDEASVRIDAGFPEDKLLSFLESRGTHYVTRVRNNAVLDRMATPHLKRPPGRPPATPRVWFHEFTYAAKEWSHERRAVLVVLEKPGELLAHHFWLITSWTAEQKPGEALLELYRERGTAEGHQGELKDVLAPALSSSPRPKSHYRGAEPQRRTKSVESFEVNEVRLLLSALAYNLMHVARVALEDATETGWSLRRLRERVLRVASRVLMHARSVTVVISDTSASLWHLLWPRIAALDVANAES